MGWSVCPPPIPFLLLSQLPCSLEVAKLISNSCAPPPPRLRKIKKEPQSQDCCRAGPILLDYRKWKNGLQNSPKCILRDIDFLKMFRGGPLGPPPKIRGVGVNPPPPPYYPPARSGLGRSDQAFGLRSPPPPPPPPPVNNPSGSSPETIRVSPPRLLWTVIALWL